jgi:hypothetical protein
MKMLEVFIESGGEYHLETTAVEAAQTNAATPIPQPLAHAFPPVGPPPVKLNVRAPVAAAPKMPHEVIQAQWDAEYSRIRGSASVMQLPKDRIHFMPALVALLQRATQSEQFIRVTGLIGNSPPEVQVSFESYEAMVTVRRGIEVCLQSRRYEEAAKILERLISFKAALSSKSKDAWLHDLQGHRREDLGWLRGAFPENDPSGATAAEAIAHLEKLLKSVASTSLKRDREEQLAVPSRVVRPPKAIVERLTVDETEEELLKRQMEFLVEKQRALEAAIASCGAAIVVPRWYSLDDLLRY